MPCPADFSRFVPIVAVRLPKAARRTPNPITASRRLVTPSLEEIGLGTSFKSECSGVGARSPEPESQLELRLLTKRERRALERVTRKRAARGRLTPALVASIWDDAQTRASASPFPAHVCCFTKLGDAHTRLPNAAGRPPGRARWSLEPESAFVIFKRENGPTTTGWSNDGNLRLRW
jgi:hypothetical protein